MFILLGKRDVGARWVLVGNKPLICARLSEKHYSCWLLRRNLGIPGFAA